MVSLIEAGVSGKVHRLCTSRRNGLIQRHDLVRNQKDIKLLSSSWLLELNYKNIIRKINCKVNDHSKFYLGNTEYDIYVNVKYEVTEIGPYPHIIPRMQHEHVQNTCTRNRFTYISSLVTSLSQQKGKMNMACFYNAKLYNRISRKLISHLHHNM